MKIECQGAIVQQNGNRVDIICKCGAVVKSRPHVAGETVSALSFKEGCHQYGGFPIQPPGFDCPSCGTLAVLADENRWI